MEAVQALRQIAFQLERSGAPTYRVRAFRRAAQVLGELPAGELSRRAQAGTLQALKGIGDTTAQVVTEAARGEVPAYLARLLADEPHATAERRIELEREAAQQTRRSPAYTDVTASHDKTISIVHAAIRGSVRFVDKACLANRAIRGDE